MSVIRNGAAGRCARLPDLTSTVLPETASWWVDATVAGQRVQLYAGDRLAPAAEVPESMTKVNLASFGAAEVSGWSGEHAEDVIELVARASTWLVEISSWQPDPKFNAKLIGSLLGDTGLADEIAHAGEEPFTNYESHKSPVLSEALYNAGVQRVDFFVATVTRRTHHVGYGLRGVHAFVHPKWVALVWSSSLDAEDTLDLPASGWDAESPSSDSLQGMRSSHVFSTEFVGDGGPQRLGRYLQHVIRHHEWNLDSAWNGLELIEADFYGRGEGLEPVTTLSEALAALGSAMVTIRLADKALVRRAETNPAFPAELKDEALRYGREQAEKGRKYRQGLREAYGLVSAASAQEQASLAGREAERMERLQHYAGYVAAIVLIPGLVAAIYGADVTGLPGQHSRVGLAVMLFLGVIGAAGTLFILRKATRESPASR